MIPTQTDETCDERESRQTARKIAVVSFFSMLLLSVFSIIELTDLLPLRKSVNLAKKLQIDTHELNQ